jgi:hypothetical protein
MKPDILISSSIINFYGNLEPKDLFDHRTNRRAHITFGSNPRG